MTDTRTVGKITKPADELVSFVPDYIVDIAQRLNVDAQTATMLWDSAGPLYEALASLNKTDSYGGHESQRVIPDAIEYTHWAASTGPRGNVAEPECIVKYSPGRTDDERVQAYAEKVKRLAEGVTA